MKAHPNIILQLVKSDQGNKCFGQVSQITSKIIAFIKSLFNIFVRYKMLRAVSFSKSTLTWEKYILKILIKLIIY